MTHGIAVWLCPTHRSAGFLRRRRGRMFADRLEASWRAAGVDTARRRAALDAHLRRMNPAPTRRKRPGSYSWPNLRRLAETRFAAGEGPRAVIDDLRRAFRDAPARVPSVQTMRRWHTEARWLGDGGPDAEPRAARPEWLRKPGWLRRPRVSRWPGLDYDMRPHPFGAWIHLWVDDRPHTGHWRKR